ncbi:tRNA (guanine(37)-N(1))-methyltransferase [Malassezia yamatoensis]|uniref:tRNA (guanine(37)-N1)-methyltransferase n=1 Tax=Malassezia yamatoensis TaxID=253288 RepID=A0AAJ6CG41_9BASI|nr:tRNA (guanine(37)-N(1))-methyltransferase [Malassezia yamatoensis]
MTYIDKPRFHKPVNPARAKPRVIDPMLEPSASVPRLQLCRSKKLPEDVPKLQSHAQAGIDMQEKASADDADRKSQQQEQLAWLEQAKVALHKTLPLLGVRLQATRVSELARHPSINGIVFRSRRSKHICSDPRGDESMRVLQLGVNDISALSMEAKRVVEEFHGEFLSHPMEFPYDYWTVEQVLRAILPEELEEGAPSAFAMVGHIAHVNLREEYLAYRYLIGQVILEKTPRVETVVNKLDSIDTEFRVFAMELLAGEPRYEAEVSESGCMFHLDFRKVYWNSRLHTEHARLIAQFQPFQVVADVMAGIGPFAVPAAKRGVWVLANDLNPHCYESLERNRRRNHVESHLQPTCLDGRDFIRQAVIDAWNAGFSSEPRADELVSGRQKRRDRSALRRGESNAESNANAVKSPAAPRRLVDRFVMNLPATALEFLDAYRGLYTHLAAHIGREALEAELAAREHDAQVENLPMVHVHTFTKDVDHAAEDICCRASKALGLSDTERLRPSNDTAANPTPDLSLHLVRTVAPNKDMYCLTFRLPRHVLFA